MAFVLTGLGSVGLLAGVLGAVLAVVVLWTRPDRSQNRRLALLLGVEAINIGAGTGLMYLTDVAAETWAWQAVTIVGLLAIPFVYLRFVATLDTPLVSFLRHPVVDRGLALGAVVAPVLWFVAPDLFMVGVHPGRFSPWDSTLRPGFMGTIFALTGASLVGLVAAISAWRRTEEGTARRAQARWYAVAFGIRDAGLPAATVAVLLVPPGITERFWYLTPAIVIPALITVLFVITLAYAILKTQLFGIELTVKRGIERSTIVAVFGVVFLLTSEVVERLVGGQGLLWGLGAAVLIGLVFKRIEAAAEAAADRLMPGVEDTEAYRVERKEEIYRAQLEELMADDQITQKERRALHRLQDDLGLDADAVNRLERDVLGASGGET